jgi:ribonuclease VapC
MAKTRFDALGLAPGAPVALRPVEFGLFPTTADGDRHLGGRPDPVRQAQSRDFAEAIERAAVRMMSAASVLEAAIVLESELGDPWCARARPPALQGRDHGRAGLAGTLGRRPVRVPSVRKGRDAAALNFGDCFSYALSKSTGVPLLFEGCGVSAHRRRVSSPALTPEAT